MNNPTIKMCFGAFVVGGVIGALAQGVFMIFSMFISNFLIILCFSLFTLVAAGGILTATGVYKKIDAVGGMGANVPLCGLASAITGGIIGARADGKSVGQAVIEGLKMPLMLLGIAAVIGVVTALIMFFVG